MDIFMYVSAFCFEVGVGVQVSGSVIVKNLGC